MNAIKYRIGRDVELTICAHDPFVFAVAPGSTDVAEVELTVTP
jgi:hypothetical protein